MKLYKLLLDCGARINSSNQNILHISNMTSKQIGDIAFENSIQIYELSNHHPTLEQIFSELVDDKSEYKGLTKDFQKEVK